MALSGYLISFFIILFFSGEIVRPVAESHEKQKRFITDAGHEIKTPLTIIKADVDILEMELGENEWLSDIQKQANRLTSLTNDLVYLSRSSRTGGYGIELSVAKAITEAHNGKIRAKTEDGHSIQLTVSLPA